MDDPKVIMKSPGGTWREQVFVSLLGRYAKGQPVADLDIEKGRMRMEIKTAVAVAIAIAGSVWGGTWWISQSLQGLRDDNRETKAAQIETNNQVKALAESLSEMKSTSYTLSRASEVALRDAIENPGRRVPDPRDPSKVIVVNSASRSDSIAEHGR